MLYNKNNNSKYCYKKRIFPNGLILMMPIGSICVIWFIMACLFVLSFYIDMLKNYYDILIILIMVTVPLMAVFILIRLFYRIKFTSSGINYAFWSWRMKKISYFEVTVTSLKSLCVKKHNIVLLYGDGKEIVVNLNAFSKKQIKEVADYLTNLLQGINNQSAGNS